MKQIVSITIVFLFLSVNIFAQAPQQMFWALNKCSKVLAQIPVKASAAYGLRKLLCDYSGPAIRVRKTTGFIFYSHTYQNIGFLANGELDIPSLEAFAGSSSLYVAVWYDQSGNGDDLTQTTLANQPRIVDNGIVDKVNGKPCLMFIDKTDEMYAPAMNIQSFSAVRRAFSSTSSGDMQYLVSVPADFDFSIRSSSSTAFTYGDFNPDDFWNSGVLYVNNVATTTYPSSLHCLYANCGTAKTATTFSLSSTFLNRGMYNNDPVSELIVFPSVLAANQRSILYSNQKIYYGTL